MTHRVVWSVGLDLTLPGQIAVIGDEVLIEILPLAPARFAGGGGGDEFDIEFIDFTVTALSGEVSVDILDEGVTWVDTCPADTDVNGAVEVIDLLALLAAWGPCPAPCIEDTDGNGTVEVIDLLALLAGWGPCP